MNALNRLKPRRGVKVDRQELSGLAARQAATDLLKAVFQDKKPLDDIIGRYGSRGSLQSLSDRDRAFARAITATTLRRHGELTFVLDQFLEKPLPGDCGKLREILLSAAAQLIFLKSPPHAVINIAVRQCQLGRKSRRFDKLANAVLRRVSEHGALIIQEQHPFLRNTPKWLLDRWTKAYGQQNAEHICAANLVEAPLDLTVKSDPQGWAQRLGGIVLPTGTVRLIHKGRIDRIEGYEDGEWWVQDAGAALPARLLGDITNKRVADLCAAPGGKTAQLIQAGASVVAVDSSAIRLDRLRENLARLKLEAETVEADIEEWQPRELFDAVLLDAPCSATGTIRRHPDILLLKSAEDIEELSHLQSRLLTKALKMLKPEGILVYCTCSLEPEEGIGQINKLIQTHEDVYLEPATDQVVGGMTEFLHDATIRTFPFQLGTTDLERSGLDGFFAARLRKV